MGGQFIMLQFLAFYHSKNASTEVIDRHIGTGLAIFIASSPLLLDGELCRQGVSKD